MKVKLRMPDIHTAGKKVHELDSGHTAPADSIKKNPHLMRGWTTRRTKCKQKLARLRSLRNRNFIGFDKIYCRVLDFKIALKRIRGIFGVSRLFLNHIFIIDLYINGSRPSE